MRSADQSGSNDGSSGLRLDIGFAGSSAGASNEVGQPVDFGGVGTRIGVGVGYGLTDTISLVAEVGYHGSFGAGEAAPISGVVGGYDATPTIYNGAFGWLAASMTFNDIEVLMGPITEFAKVQTQGSIHQQVKWNILLDKRIIYLYKEAFWLLDCLGA